MQPKNDEYKLYMKEKKLYTFCSIFQNCFLRGRYMYICISVNYLPIQYMHIHIIITLLYNCSSVVWGLAANQFNDFISKVGLIMYAVQ